MTRPDPGHEYNIVMTADGADDSVMRDRLLGIALQRWESEGGLCNDSAWRAGSVNPD